MKDVVQAENSTKSQETVRSTLSTINNKRISRMHPAEQQTLGNALNGFHARPTPVSVAVDPVALITTECITVTSAMRKHARWAHSSVSAILGGSTSPSSSGRYSTLGDDLGPNRGHRRKSSPVGSNEDSGLANRWGLRGKKGKSMQDNPLMAGFGRLRRELVGCKGSSELLFSPYIWLG
jgi:hypothetical protein